MNRPQPMAHPAPREAPAGPPVDLTREAESLLLVISLPGMRAGDFRISLVGNRQVYIEGTVPYLHPAPRESLALSERPYGTFSRTVSLPFPVDPGRVTVGLERGVLKVRLPLQMQRVPLQGEGGSRPEQPR